MLTGVASDWYTSRIPVAYWPAAADEDGFYCKFGGRGEAFHAYAGRKCGRLTMAMNRREFVRSGGAVALAAAASRWSGAQSKPITMAAVGDCMITRRISQLDSPGLLWLWKLLR